MLTDVPHLRESERWIANVRVGAVAFAVLQVALSTGYPPGYEIKAWTTTVVFGIGAAILFWLSREETAARAAGAARSCRARLRHGGHLARTC